jgi:hypothetical protein
MFRRVFSIIVMLGFVAGQLATMPHAHGSSRQPVDHGTRPHIHVALHEHASHSHGHDGDADHHHGKESRSHSDSSTTNTNQDGHDSDAVYLPDGAGNLLLSKGVQSLEHPQANSMLAVASVDSPLAATHFSVAANFPSESSSGCPLYLELRALRI